MNILIEIDSQYHYCSSSNELTSTHISDIYYNPIVGSFPTISRSVGSEFYGKTNISSISVSLVNLDGALDFLYSLFMNKSVIVRSGNGNSIGGYSIIFSGKISDINNSSNEVTINLSDQLNGLKKSIDFRYYLTSDYPDLLAENNNRPIAQIWGQRNMVPCVCLNEIETTPTNYTFKVCDTSINQLAAIDNVFVGNTPVTFSNVSLSNGTFTITAVDLGLYNFTEVSATASNSITNAVDLVQDIVDSTIPSTIWNTSELDEARAKAFITSYYIGDVGRIVDAIDSVMNDTNLIMFSELSEELTVRFFDQERIPTRIIKNHEYAGDFDSSNNITEFLSSVIITFSPSAFSESKSYHRVDTYESEAEAWYGEKVEKTIDTNLVSITDAELKGSNLLYLSKEFRETFTRPIRLVTSDNIKLFDFVAAEPNQRDTNVDEGNYSTYQVLGIADDHKTAEKLLTLRYIKGYNFINTWTFLQDQNFDFITDQNGLKVLTGNF